MTEPAPAKADPTYDRTKLIGGGAVIIALGATVFFLVKIIRSSPCMQHTDGESPLVEVAKQSAKMRLTDHPLPHPPETDEAPTMNGSEPDTMPSVVPPRKPRSKPVTRA